ncbi:uncharacterized protein LOC121860954 isoform X2 [Homarus americanus]|uniref:uncharacterized protein LOC121860954 isoform X2 n=1 Tax=Homarus americanus TaxID=6706 RepID=UPI001C462A44|nr:uncharacterized protein LOC121860954 isoform X2 [Homarus americanus]
MHRFSTPYIFLLISSATLCTGANDNTTDMDATEATDATMDTNTVTSADYDNITTPTVSPKKELHFADFCCLTKIGGCSTAENTECRTCMCLCRPNYTYLKEMNTCVDPNLPITPCNTTLNCPENLLCTNDLCACPLNYTYLKERLVCVDPQLHLMACTSSYNCLEGLICVNGMCACPSNFVYNKDKSVCEPGEPGVVKEGNLPNQPCSTDSDCVEGLICLSSKTCDCPFPCEYREEMLVCDCGREDYLSPILSGIVLGLIIVVFWTACIFSTVQKHHQKRNKVSQLNRRTSGISTLGAVYGTDHIHISQGPHPRFRAPPTSGLQRHTVAPTSPLRPAFRPQPMTTVGPGYTERSHAPPLYSANNYGFAPLPQVGLSTFPLQHQQIYNGDNAAYKFTSGKPPDQQCPSSAPEGRRPSSVSASSSGNPAPSQYEAPRSARF